MKILIFSDSHVCGPPSGWEALFDKRVVGLFNHHYLRKHHHNQAYLDEALKYIDKNPPDMVLCTGDITTSSEPSEFEVTCQKLAPLVNDKRFKFFFIPGNHDNYVDNPVCQQAMKDAVKYLNNGRFCFEDLPYHYETDELDFSFVNECFPVNLILSCGMMKKDTQEYLYRWLDRKKTKPKVLIGHYPLDEGNPVMRCRHRLYGQKKIIEYLKKGILLI